MPFVMFGLGFHVALLWVCLLLTLGFWWTAFEVVAVFGHALWVRRLWSSGWEFR